MSADAQQLAALHAYRERVQLEVASLAGTLRGLAADAADRIDANGPDLHYQGGAHNAYLAASRLCDRALLLAEEAAGKAVGPSTVEHDSSDGRAD
jgi:hypothetical protein